ncbi:hypothetical protein [Pollutibacter soli]|uniref:hypothetical protein n=1 Tax=Pollutibacter soli TaxID=3034157 RepID=UPI003013B3AD
MKLMMYLGNDLIESVDVEKSSLSKPGFLGRYKRALKEKYKEMITANAEPPEFFVIQPEQTQALNA